VTKKKSTKGGAREGSGRKRLNRRMITPRIPSHLWHWLHAEAARRNEISRAQSQGETTSAAKMAGGYILAGARGEGYEPES
jgi:hypothetical protein